MRYFLILLVLIALAPGAPFMAEVRYEVTGSVRAANLTRKNKEGGSEQLQIDVPYTDTFYAAPGAQLYLSAQKARITKEDGGLITPRYILISDGVEGTVHVLIRVGGKILQEADASAPFGIATASGTVPE
jgi:hypothetical protein